MNFLDKTPSPIKERVLILLIVRHTAVTDWEHTEKLCKETED